MRSRAKRTASILPGRAALAEAARHQNAVHAVELLHGIRLLEDFRIDPFQLDLHLVGDAAMGEGLGQRLIAVQQIGVFADDGDAHFAFRRAHGVDDALPARQIRLGLEGQGEMAQHFAVHAGFVIGNGHGVDRVHVQGRDDRLGAHIAEAGDLAALVLGDRAVAAADQHLRLDADILQFLDGMLGRLGFQLAGGGDVGHQGEVHEHRALGRQLVAELADGFQEGQALDIADRAADFDQHKVEFGGSAQHDILDGVGDMRNDLDGGAEIVAAAFLGDHLGIDFARRRIVELARGNAGEALVMAEIEVGLRPVIGHEDLAVLVRAHRARIDIEIGIKLAQPNGIAAGLQQCAEGRRGDTLTEGGDHAAGDKYKPRHGIRSYMSCGKSERGRNTRGGRKQPCRTRLLPVAVPGRWDCRGGGGCRSGQGVGRSLRQGEGRPGRARNGRRPGCSVPGRSGSPRRVSALLPL